MIDQNNFRLNIVDNATAEVLIDVALTGSSAEQVRNVTIKTLADIQHTRETERAPKAMFSVPPFAFTSEPMVSVKDADAKVKAAVELASKNCDTVVKQIENEYETLLKKIRKIVKNSRVRQNEIQRKDGIDYARMTALAAVRIGIEELLGQE